MILELFCQFFCRSIKRSIQELINLGQKGNKINYRELKYYIDTEMIVQSDNFFSETGSSDLATYNCTCKALRNPKKRT